MSRPEIKSTKTLGVPVSDTYNYLRVLNGLIELTDTEMEILAAFIDIKKSLSKAGVDMSPFSTDMKKKVAERLGRDDFNTLNNYIKKFVEKGAIKKTDDGYEIKPALIPGERPEKISIVLYEK